MILPHDLRFGNVVLYKKKPVTVLGISNIYLNVMTNTARGMGQVSHEWVDGMPLTPKILIKLGFRFEMEEQKEPHPVQKAMGIIPYRQCAYLSPCDDSSFTLYDHMIFRANEDGSFDNEFTINSNPYDGYTVPCEFLHTLQNLYYSLTGVELKYKP